MDIGRNILRLREKKNLSASELADLVGAKKQQVYAWEQGKYGPGKKILPILAEVLGVSVSDLYEENITQVRESDERYLTPDVKSLQSQIELLRELIDSKDEQIELLKKLKNQ